MDVVDVATLAAGYAAPWSSGFGETATFCHACVEGGVKWGHTCWGVTPADDVSRACGCSSQSWAGTGVYYGGYKGSAEQCSAEGGGFAGPKATGEQKGKNRNGKNSKPKVATTVHCKIRLQLYTHCKILLNPYSRILNPYLSTCLVPRAVAVRERVSQTTG